MRIETIIIGDDIMFQGSEGRLYVVVRNDLSAGLQAAQAVHAVGEFRDIHTNIYDEWFSKSNFIAILQVKDYHALKELMKTLNNKNIRFTSFREPDLGNEITSLCIEPGIESRKVLSSLPLALKGYSYKDRKDSYKIRK